MRRPCELFRRSAPLSRLPAIRGVGMGGRGDLRMSGNRRSARAQGWLRMVRDGRRGQWAGGGGRIEPAMLRGQFWSKFSVYFCGVGYRRGATRQPREIFTVVRKVRIRPAVEVPCLCWRALRFVSRLRGTLLFTLVYQIRRCLLMRRH